MLIGVVHSRGSNCGTSKESVEHILFRCALMIPTYNFLDNLKPVLPNAFKAFHCGSIFNEDACTLFTRKTVMLVNDKCSTWHNRSRVGIFVVNLVLKQENYVW